MKALTIEKAKEVSLLLDDLNQADPDTMYHGEDRYGVIQFVKALYENGFVIGEK